MTVLFLTSVSLGRRCSTMRSFAALTAVVALCLCCMAMMMRTDVRPVGLEQDRLDVAAEKLAKTLKGGRRGQAPLKRPAAFEAPDLVHHGYPLDGDGGSYQAEDHAIVHGRAASPQYSGETDVLNKEAEKVFGRYRGELHSPRGIQWNKMGRFEPPAVQGSDVLNSKAAAMRQTMDAAQRMASNKVVPREYVSWVMKQRGKRDHNPYDAPRYPSLHWKDYVEHEWPAQIASTEPQEPGYHLGGDGAPYAQYMNRKMSDALREHFLKQAAMAERIKQLQQQFGDVPAGGASGGDAQGGGVSKMVFDRKVRDMRVNQFEPSERDAVLDADSDGKLEHAMSARVDRAKAEAEAIAAAVREGVKDAVEEVEEGMEKQEGRMGEDVSKDVAESVAEAVSPVEGKVERESEEVSAQGKKIAEMHDRLERIEQGISAAIPSAATEESSPSPPVPAPSSTAPAPSPVAPAGPPSVVSFSIPGKVTLPPGPYTFSIGNKALPLAAAPAADQSSPEAATSSSSSSSPDESSAPEVSPADEPSEKGEGEGGDDGDGVLNTAVDLDNGVDGERVKAAAHELMKKLIASATSDPAPAGGDDGDAPALSSGDDGVLDSFTGTSAGVDTDAVRAAAHALQERVIANAMGGGSAAASSSSGGGDDVLDSSMGMHSGVDTAAVAAAAKDLQERVIASVATGNIGGGGSAASGDDVLDSAKGMDTGVDDAAVVAAAHALQKHTIERTNRAGTGQQQAARGDDDVLDSVSGMDSGVDAKAVSKAALRLQREIAARLSRDLPK